MITKRYGRSNYTWNEKTAAVTRYDEGASRGIVIGYAEDVWEFRQLVRDEIADLKSGSVYFPPKVVESTLSKSIRG